MNWAHLHLLSNHLPVIGTLFALGLLGWGVLRRNDAVQRVALGTFVVVALLALPAYFTGDPAEGAVEHAAGVAESSIAAHEAAALVSLVAAGLVGLVGLVALYRGRRGRSLAAPLTALALVMATVTAGLMAWTANLGGAIRHPEIRAVGTPQAPVHAEEGEGQ